MKLELKHWAAYLPYKLMVLLESKLYTYPILIGIINSNNLYLSYYGTSLSVVIDKAKPILRSLSDLTEEIEVNGEKFIPIEELLHEINSLVIGGEKYSKEEMLSMCNNSYYSEAWITDRLTEWHFDIFGLIDAGLAVEFHVTILQLE